MSVQENGVRTRRALNSLQYSPNGKDIAGLTTSSAKVQTKKGLFESKNSNNVRNGLKKRTSISLPDICGTNQALKSLTSTPCKNHRTTSTSTTPTKIPRKEVIESVIQEEKENPNVIMNDKKNGEKVTLKDKQIKNRENLTKFKEISIQCNKSDEDMLLSISVEGTPYWKLLAHKRLRCLIETEKENEKLNESIADLDKINDDLRERNNHLYGALKEYNEIKKQLLESIEECDEEDDEENDSGYEKSQLNFTKSN
ncbi:unnamed protein product [Brachionus calyciflorus]|uniref:Geminin n=1 Tax=Brachionus calyciflorus TaxID=104777 RepID=A0A814N115_9BILA|nr:unnamed protein product [Brachionus calyciflorus]